MQVDEALKNKTDVLAAFLNVSGAFNHVNSDILLDTLAKIGCSPQIIKFIKFLTHDRYVYTNVEGYEKLKAHKGVPQGGVLSPLLYIIYVSCITKDIPENVTVSQFADDICIYSKIVPLKQCKMTIENSADIIIEKLYYLGLDIATDKTVLIHFNNKNILPGTTEIKINNTEIKSSETVRFLGITFDYKLTFNQHINKINTRCNRAMTIIKFLRGTWWGSDPQTLITLYKSYVRSVIEYASFVYFPTRKNSIYKLERIQYQAIRLALGYRRSTPTNILLAESKLPLLSERAKFLANRYVTKVLANRKSMLYSHFTYDIQPTKRKRKRLLIECVLYVKDLTECTLITLNNLPIYVHDFSTITTSIPIDIELGEKLKNNQYPNYMLEQLIEKNKATAIYTDGSKEKDKPFVGSACFVPKTQETVKKSMNINASVYTAECFALYNAMNLALQ